MKLCATVISWHLDLDSPFFMSNNLQENKFDQNYLSLILIKDQTTNLKTTLKIFKMRQKTGSIQFLSIMLLNKTNVYCTSCSKIFVVRQAVKTGLDKYRKLLTSNEKRIIILDGSIGIYD